jgi:hypothetical protein
MAKIYDRHPIDETLPASELEAHINKYLDENEVAVFKGRHKESGRPIFHVRPSRGEHFIDWELIFADGTLHKSQPYFGCCSICGEHRLVDVGNAHWYYCPTHKICWWVGANLMSTWKEETLDKQLESVKKLEGCTVIDLDRTPKGLFDVTAATAWLTNFWEKRKNTPVSDLGVVTL